MDADNGPNDVAAHHELAREAAHLAAICAVALKEKGLLIDADSEAAAQCLSRMAAAARLGGGQLAETDFDRAASYLRRGCGVEDPSP